MSGGFGAIVSLFAQGMVIVTIAAPAIILFGVGIVLAGRAVLRRVKGTADSGTPESRASREVLISADGWGKQIHRTSSASSRSTSSATQAQDLPGVDELPATGAQAIGELSAMGDVPVMGDAPAMEHAEPERRRA